ncbi:MAG: DNA primase [Smithella sp. PtaU1.Bin162]|nr:MAG: DNA primase [Smithella sp. PtaU1.Bin162]
MHFDDGKIEEIKSRIDIVELAAEYLTLKKAGRNYLGLCPFHSEKTPSFTVNRDKQIFYCFGCGAGGNVITFLMKITNKTFPEAIKELAEKAGVVLPPKFTGKEGRAGDSLREKVVDLNLRAAQFYERNLHSSSGKGAQDYLNARGIRPETVKQFRLGFAPDAWRYLTDHIEKSDLSLKIAEQAGLIITGKEGGFYDRFRARLIFPIESVSGEIIAFGGRILDKGEPKYLNSPESPVYIKGKNLYGLARTKEEIRKKGFALIVEGYFDLISLWNAGIGNVVASLGTALTREQLELLRRYTVEVVALFDPDEAGRKALNRSLELFLSMNMRARALVLPEGLDPDDYVKKFGRARLEELIAEAQPLSDYYIENVLGDGKSFEDKREMIKTAMEFISKIGDKKEKDIFVKRIAEKTGLDQGLLIKEVYKNEFPAKPAKEILAVHNDLMELHLIQLMLEYPQRTIEVEKVKILNYFLQPRLKALGEKIIETYKLLGFVDLSVILAADEDASLRERIFRLMMEAQPLDDIMLERIFTDNIRQIKKKWYKDQHRLIKFKLAQAQEKGHQDILKELLKEKEKLLIQEKELH